MSGIENAKLHAARDERDLILAKDNVKVGTSWRYCKPVYSANGKIKPDYVLVNRKAEEHKEGAYYLRFSANGGSWKKIGTRASEAQAAATYDEAVRTAKAQGIPVKEDATPAPSISVSLYGYLQDYKLSQRAESYNLMRHTLNEFVGFVKKTEISSITCLDLLRYKEWLQNRPAREGAKNTLRTSGNKMLRVNQFLRSVQKLEPGKGLVTVKDGKFVETEPEVFTPKELEAFFKEASGRQAAGRAYCQPFYEFVFKTYLMAGLRKQELENLEWADVNFETSTLRVSAKQGFQPKTWEERTIEIPATLLETFRQARREAIERCDPNKVVRLVFHNRNENKYTHSWDDCQDIAEAAGVRDAHPHKFRATYATRLLQNGVDLKTVQKLLGHKNLESTMRYLAKAQSAEVRAKVDVVFPEAVTVERELSTHREAGSK